VRPPSDAAASVRPASSGAASSGAASSGAASNAAASVLASTRAVATIAGDEALGVGNGAVDGLEQLASMARPAAAPARCASGNITTPENQRTANRRLP